MLAQGWTVFRNGIAADQDRLVLWLPVFLGVGVLSYFALTTEPPVRLGMALVAVSACLFALARRSRLVHATAAALLALSIGFASAQLAARRMPPMPVLPRKAALVTGAGRGDRPAGGRAAARDAGPADDRAGTAQGRA